MTGMRVDHVVYAAERDGLKATAQRLAKQIGVTPVDGGVHPRFGTRNIILPLAHERYVEVVEVLDHPASDKAPFGQAVRARSEAGGGWLGWVVAGRRHLRGRESASAARRSWATGTAPTGSSCAGSSWASRGCRPTRSCPTSSSGRTACRTPPTTRTTEVTIETLQIAGDPDRVRDWLGLPADSTSSVIDFEFVSPHGTPGLMAVTFDTPTGEVTI